MHLNGWIGLEKGPREARLHLAGDKPTLSPRIKEQISLSPSCAGPRIVAFETAPEKVHRKYLN
jgi:hypothetical protein